MSNVNNSANMSLPIPVALADTGPDWAYNINASLTLIDGHDHSAGKGVLITPSGFNINADLPFNNHNAISMRSSRFQAQSAALALAADLGCVYVAGVDLYYNDINGNQIRLTQSGSIVGTSGSISGLPSGTASASYQAIPQSFVWQSATNTPANLDAASIVLRNLSLNSFGLTLNPPTAMGADISMTLPTIPGVTNLMTMDNAGNMAAAANVDNSTLQFSANTLAVKNLGIGTAQLANASVTPAKKAALGQQISASAGAAATITGTTPTQVTNLTVTITTTGRPVFIGVINDGTTNDAILAIANASVVGAGGIVYFYKNGSEISHTLINTAAGAAAIGIKMAIPVSTLFYIDTPAAGTYTYAIYGSGLIASDGLIMQNCKLIAYEL